VRNERRIGSIVFLLLFGLVGCGQNKFQQEVNIETSGVKLVREVQRGGYDLITASELKELLDKQADIVLIDTMPSVDSYDKEHIPGAINFMFPIADDMTNWDIQMTGGKTKDQYEALLGPEKERQIVVYCGFVKCTRSHIGATWAKMLGYTNVKRFAGGIYAWKGMGFPVNSTK